MKTFLQILQAFLGFSFILAAFFIECMCQITYVRNPSDLAVPRIVAFVFFFAGVLLFQKKDSKE